MSLTEPLRFEPVFVDKVWGGRSLESFLGQPLPGDAPIGEVWSLVDRDDASSVVAEGSAYAGRSLRGLMLSEREALLGRSAPAQDGSFPLLIKYLDVRETLSVQVHPDARAVESIKLGAEEKNECWYVLEAEKDAQIQLGFREGVDRSEIGDRVGTPDFCDLLASHTVQAEDFINVPAGTVHAIGGCMTLVEVQQNSDTTYRIYDWGRVGLDGKPRELHVDEALRSIDYERAVEGPVHPQPMDPEALCPTTPLLDGPIFGVRRVDVGASLELELGGLCRVLIVLEGHGELIGPDEGAGPWAVEKGQTWLLPACFPRFTLHSTDGQLSVLDVETRS